MRLSLLGLRPLCSGWLQWPDRCPIWIPTHHTHKLPSPSWPHISHSSVPDAGFLEVFWFWCSDPEQHTLLLRNPWAFTHLQSMCPPFMSLALSSWSSGDIFGWGPLLASWVLQSVCRWLATPIPTSYITGPCALCRRLVPVHGSFGGALAICCQPGHNVQLAHKALIIMCIPLCLHAHLWWCSSLFGLRIHVLNFA